jgi:hypothetical protein
LKGFPQEKIMKKWMVLGCLILLTAACAFDGAAVAKDAGLKEIGRSERFIAYDRPNCERSDNRAHVGGG